MDEIIQLSNSESSESEESHHDNLPEDSDEEIFFSGNIEPFSFEPTCSEEELQRRVAALSTQTENTELSTSSHSTEEVSNWCSCGVCRYVDTEPVNICCKSVSISMHVSRKPKISR